MSIRPIGHRPETRFTPAANTYGTSFLHRTWKAACVALLNLTGNSAVSAESLRVHPTQHKWYNNEIGLDQLIGWKHTPTLCYLPKETFESLVDKPGETGFLAQYYLGRWLACPWHARNGYPAPRGEEQEQEFLKGLLLMHRTAGLKILYPKQGQSFENLVTHHKMDDPSNAFYKIDGCLYFTDGTLLCPNVETFNRLQCRFEASELV
jgi:hypothetical protein